MNTHPHSWTRPTGHLLQASTLPAVTSNLCSKRLLPQCPPKGTVLYQCAHIWGRSLRAAVWHTDRPSPVPAAWDAPPRLRQLPPVNREYADQYGLRRSQLQLFRWNVFSGPGNCCMLAEWRGQNTWADRGEALLWRQLRRQHYILMARRPYVQSSLGIAAVR